MAGRTASRARRGGRGRVEITYDLERGGTTVRKELPFVLGVIGDFVGKAEQPQPKLRERAFVEVNRDSLDSVIRGFQPRLVLKVANRLGGAHTDLAVTLRFEGLQDFEPERVTAQVPELRALLELRSQLSQARSKLRPSPGTGGSGDLSTDESHRGRRE